MQDTRLHALIDKFIAGGQRNGWLTGEFCELYVRCSHRVIDHTVIHCLDLANIQILKARHRQQGILRAILDHVESLNLPVYVELVHDDWLVAALHRRGYRLTGNGNNLIYFPPKV